MLTPMRSGTLTITLACGGALAYTISKIDLALRERIGMPGFPAPPSSYEDIPNVAAAQLGNAALGFVLVLLTAALFRPPKHTLTRRLLLGANWLGVAMVGAGVVGFTLRATGLAPALGEPASGAAAWISLTVGAVWTVSWALASHGARRTPSV
ncbi:hypothetical protein Snas_0040 [Stackebrandtia nassauensis DSM 44728]|uniref:DUF998 domain-containing protein n=2 Tax=Stackebrandtia TaxID=283810 RepID=D3QC42_STANL|nr:hypothetical protein Snas_0040 [Stackebrandtia nassauensis DSM 44728]